ncbi:MAG: hydroxymethylbilane synthase [Acidobacteria bacterium]|nr:hydroxymethylbilane synthase [Acidobacteriota bacterium]
MRERLIIGSRGSQLALWQTNFVRHQLARMAPMPIEIATIKTTGDKHLETPIAQLDKGMFVKEIERALLSGEIDLAVHSMKDLPTEIPSGLTIAAVCARHDVRDCFISRDGATLQSLAPGSRIGTSSLRRRAQLRYRRSDLEFADIRGNVDTRWRKLREGLFEAIVLAKAGLDRLGWADQITEVLSTEIVLPAVGQGALGIEARAEDMETLSLLEPLNHPPTNAAVMAERALLGHLEGGCQVPIGAWGRVEDGRLILEGCVISLDGETIIRDSISGLTEDSVALGARLAEKLLARGADRILAEVNAYRRAQEHVGPETFES